MYLIPLILISVALCSVAGAEHIKRNIFHHTFESDTHLPRAAVSSIPSTQPLYGPSFNGSSIVLNPLVPKTQYTPQVVMMHSDGGNTGSFDYSGPIGHNAKVESYSTSLAVLLFDSEGRLTSGGITSTGVVLHAINPTSLEVLSTWTPPPNSTLILTYMQMTMDDRVIVPTKQGSIFVIQRNNTTSHPTFETVRVIELQTFLSPGEVLLNSMHDSESNIWFTTGGIIGAGDVAQPSTTLGYVTPSGAVHVQHIADQMVENGIAVSGKTVFVVTGPAGASYNTNSTGNMYAFEAAPQDLEPIKVLWNQPYAAGDSLKAGGFARGSGTTPTLLGDEYLAITDNANAQISMLIYRQKPHGTEPQLVCKVPIFEPGFGACDTGTIGHCDSDGRCAAVAFNTYNAPPILLAAPTDINGDFNNFTQLAPGMVRVDVYPNGTGCEVNWENDVRVIGGGSLSTKTGLLYTYTQDSTLAEQGLYQWYVEAVNWETGKVEWSLRTGAGGTYNSGAAGNLVAPDDTLFQGVLGGLVRVRDIV
ncbi:hypothetical protein B0O99DRAFT_743186 [Bisporella sp. PMI_857]|nr:hypothetical protein B0O99DRAFT_743186 [Bisporella sp. PMI_857]